MRITIAASAPPGLPDTEASATSPRYALVADTGTAGPCSEPRPPSAPPRRASATLPRVSPEVAISAATSELVTEADPGLLIAPARTTSPSVAPAAAVGPASVAPRGAVHIRGGPGASPSPA